MHSAGDNRGKDSGLKHTVGLNAFVVSSKEQFNWSDLMDDGKCFAMNCT